MASVETPFLDGRPVSHLGKVRVKPINEGSGVHYPRRSVCDVNRCWLWTEVALLCIRQAPLTLSSTLVFMWKM